jgi:hypothetical protein
MTSPVLSKVTAVAVRGPKSTVVAPATKFDPQMVAFVPPAVGPAPGEKRVMVGAGS